MIPALLLLALAPAAGAIASDTCARCHSAQTKSFKTTSMSKALETVEDSQILQSHPKLTFRSGSYSYTIQRDGKASIYTVTDGTQTFSIPLAWAFGLGAAGQTYVFEKDGVRYESRVSFYRETGALDLTMGAASISPKNIVEAAGRQMSKKDDVGCFGCHSGGGVRQGELHFDSLVPGVQCQNCHADAAKHAASLQSPVPQKLSKLNAEEISDLCGKCHRTWADIASGGPRGVVNVRFQPYRLANSKCYDAADARIACTACHDPHHEVTRSAAAYDSKCTACHAAGKTTHICRVATSNCASCHMPKFEIPGSHHAFSDHQIRIVRANETYPN